MRQKRARIDLVRDLIREQPGRVRAAYWRLARSRGVKKSTFYFQMGGLRKRGELMEIPGPHGPRLFLRKSEAFANPDYVKDLVGKALMKVKSDSLRRSVLHDLVLLAQEKPIFVDGDLLFFFRSALNDVDNPLNSAAFELLGAVVARYSTAIATKDLSIGADVELECLWDGVGEMKGIREPLIQVVRNRPDHATWALQVLSKFTDTTLQPSELITYALTAAFSKALTMAAFENLEPTVLKLIILGLDKNPGEYQRLRELLERYLASEVGDESERARRIWNFLGPKFTEHFGRFGAGDG